jgi:putative peptidoglycan lipid II flippase
MSAVLLALQAVLFPQASGVARLAALALLVGSGFATYFGAAHLIGALDLRDAARLLRRRPASRST